MMQLVKLTALFVLTAVMFAHRPLVHACAVCLTGADGSVADAYDWSVLFLMATPYLVMGTIAGYLFYAYRRAAAKREQQAALEEAAINLAWDPKESGR
jgi:hypothetical protein